MKTQPRLDLLLAEFEEVSKEDLQAVNGGSHYHYPTWMYVAGFLVSPAFGILNAGLLDGLSGH